MRAAAGAICVAIAGLCVLPTAASAGARSFAFTGGEQTFSVPARVTRVHVVARGAPGGVGGFSSTVPGGSGALVSADLAVTPGQILYIDVGGIGTQGHTGGGFNGGGNAAPFNNPDYGGGGGGASDVRLKPRTAAGTLASRSIVAGGGGGGSAGGEVSTAGAGGAAGAKGGDAGDSTNTYMCTGGDGGLQGTASAGGTGGAGGTTGNPGFESGNGDTGDNGQFGVGGNSGDGLYAGGGGGGGYFGGGGGGTGGYDQAHYCASGGGGGGSSHVGSGTSNTSISGDDSGVPSIALTWTVPPDRTPPSIQSLAISPDSFVAANAGPSVQPAKAVGADVFFKLSEAATVRFTVERGRPGIKHKGKCVAPPKPKPSGAKACTRYVGLKGSFTQSGGKGLHSFRFMGRLNGKTLAKGKYRLAARPTDSAHNVGKTVRQSFKIKG